MIGGSIGAFWMGSFFFPTALTKEHGILRYTWLRSRYTELRLESKP